MVITMLMFSQLIMNTIKHRTIFDDYIDYQEKFEKKYGSNTIVLMEVGSFFEIYGVETENDTVGKVSEISALLNIHKTRKNKKILENSRKNPLMAGFPNHALKKFIRVLIKNGYTKAILRDAMKNIAPNQVLNARNKHSLNVSLADLYNIKSKNFSKKEKNKLHI